MSKLPLAHPHPSPLLCPWVLPEGEGIDSHSVWKFPKGIPKIGMRETLLYCECALIYSPTERDFYNLLTHQLSLSLWGRLLELFGMSITPSSSERGLYSLPVPRMSPLPLGEG